VGLVGRTSPHGIVADALPLPTPGRDKSVPTDQKDLGETIMADPRQQKLAQVLVHYSLKIQAGDRLIIHAPMVATPLVREIYLEALRAGAHITPRIDMDELYEIQLREGSDEQLTHVSEIDVFENEHMNKYLGIWASQNTRALSKVKPERIALRDKANAAISKRFLRACSKG